MGIYEDAKQEETVTVKRGAGGRGLLALSLIINVVLASACGYMYSLNQQMSGEAAEYVSRLNQLAEKTVQLEQRLNMSASQLDYYKELTNYYAASGDASGNASGIIGEASIPILAVQTMQTFFQTSYQGYVLRADVELVEGQGRVLVNTEVLNGMDIQTSVRTAAAVVEELMGVSFSNTDIILTITSDVKVDAVDGPSAGGAITVALLAALQHVEVMDGVYMTGTVNSDGSVGKVGGVPYKALAAVEEGAEVIIVPVGQGTVTMYEPKTVQVGRFTMTTYEKVTMELEEYLQESGYSVKIVEVVSVLEAYDAFTGQSL
ncbi:MAG TPA: S16 family serine protease [Candidatus Krumholzibacteriaceae bacterium]|nr:S16 family serine protease [Candidatus Krumholzibacteriaceae bacterium]